MLFLSSFATVVPVVALTLLLCCYRLVDLQSLWQLKKSKWCSQSCDNKDWDNMQGGQPGWLVGGQIDGQCMVDCTTITAVEEEGGQTALWSAQVGSCWLT